jgi:hypothetical protein
MNMAGYQAIIELRRLEEEVDKLGLMLCASKHGSWAGSNSHNDLVAIKPKDADSLPIYSRDAELFTGSLEQLRVWIRGVHWAREYDSMLKLSDEKKRTAKEDQERARQFSAKQGQLLEKLKKDHTNEHDLNPK